MFRYYFLFNCAFVFISPFLFSDDQPELKTVSYVDLNRFSGEWHEISRLRNPWELACAKNTTITYTTQADGNLRVSTECRSDKIFHPLEKAEGTAQVVDKTTHAKWKLSFPGLSHYDWVYSGDYWIIGLAEDYSYAVISEPTQTHLWILSRSPTMSNDLYENILAKTALELQKVNVLNIMRTEQTSASSK